ncbi:MAG: (E)-4-hydroxy-3-methylbut-2-enyl-diphosphate synthase [Bacteroidales bacterium]
MGKNYTYAVPHSRVIRVGTLEMGSGFPVVVQSMANTNTADLSSSLAQLEKMADVGAQLVRFTTQGLKEVASLEKLIRSLTPEYAKIPVVADVHFSSRVALEAAKVCHKVRINPGNFTERSGKIVEYTEELYNEGLQENRKMLIQLIEVCKAHNTALRIGVNHGSLSQRIMSRYGNTPAGMVASALEFLRICREEQFHNVVVSLKSSNTVLMIHSVRLLVKKMIEEDLYYPLHLGVTESGDGMEGRIKSVVGMAPLLSEGIGDTIRVSLTEPPENELPVARLITSVFKKPDTLPYDPLENLPWDSFNFNEYSMREVHGVGGTNPPVVISPEGSYDDPEPDFMFAQENDRTVLKSGQRLFYPVFFGNADSGDTSFLMTDTGAEPAEIAAIKDPRIVILHAENRTITDVKNWMISYIRNKGTNPIILRKKYADKDEETYMIRASGEFALLLADRQLSGIWIENSHFSPAFNNRLSFAILQASRNRITSTEYIACPSCGRTQFDIQSVLAAVRTHTAHLTGLKIAVMGCIVNGPGEMADADYGYIGTGKGFVSIYKGKDVVAKKVPANDAISVLIQVIKDHGDWIEP